MVGQTGRGQSVTFPKLFCKKLPIFACQLFSLKDDVKRIGGKEAKFLTFILFSREQFKRSSLLSISITEDLHYGSKDCIFEKSFKI